MKFGRRRRRTETEITVPVFTQPGRSPASVPVLLPLSFHSLPHPLHQSASSAAQLPLRHGSEEQYSPAVISSCSASPFLIHKLPKQQSVAAVASSLPTQLSYPTITCGAQLARTLAPPGGPLVLHRFRFLLSLGAVHPHRAKP